MNVNEPRFPRVTTPDETRPMSVANLIHHLHTLLQAHGDLPVYVYSSATKQAAPMLKASCFCNWTGRLVVISPVTDTVLEEMYYDLVMAARAAEVQP